MGLYSKCIFHFIAIKSLCAPPPIFLTLHFPTHSSSGLCLMYHAACLQIWWVISLLLLSSYHALCLKNPSQSAWEMTYLLAFSSQPSQRLFFINFFLVAFLQPHFYLVQMFVIFTRTHCCTSWFINKSKCLSKTEPMPYLSHLFSAYCMHIVGALS